MPVEAYVPYNTLVSALLLLFRTLHIHIVTIVCALR
jgi:hypothetical protein